MEDNNKISASEFKKHFLTLVAEVKNKRSSFIVTKRNVPIARVIPLEDSATTEPKSFFGCMKGTAKIKDDILNFSSELDWEACNN